MLKNKVNGALKQIKCPLDLDAVEKILLKAEEVNTHVNKNTLPDRIPYRDDQCGRCSFKTLCCPAEPRTEMEFSSSVELGELLNRRGENKEFNSIYTKTDKRLKEMLNNSGHEKILCEGWLCRLSGNKRKTWKIERVSDGQTQSGEAAG